MLCLFAQIRLSLSFSFLSLIFLLTSFSCSRDKNVPVIKLKSITESSYVQVNKSFVSGPYKTNIDSLLKISKHVESVNPFLSLNRGHLGKAFKKYYQVLESGIESLDFSQITEEKKYDNCFYTTVIIKASKPGEYVIMSGNRMGMEIWMNGTKIQGTLGKRVYNGYNQFQNYTKIELKRGKNYLDIKHYCSAAETDWTSICHISTYEYAKEYYYRKSNFDLIESGIVPIGGTLVLSNKFAFHGEKEYVEVSDKNGRRILAGEFDLSGNNTFDLPLLSEGIYYCMVQFPGFKTIQPFYYGDIEYLKKDFVADIELLKSKAPEDAIHLDALLKRMNHLMKFRSFSGQVVSHFSLSVSSDEDDWKNIYNGSSGAVHCDSCCITADTTFRYLKFTGHMNSANTYNNLAEMKARDMYGEEIKPVRITSSGYYGNQLPDFISDNNYNTYWEQEGDGKWLCLDFGRNLRFNEICLAFNKNILEEELEVRLWNRKIIILVDELERLKNKAALTNNIYQKTPGRHLRGYLSDIDSDTLNYLIQVPEAAKDGKPLPLVLFIPINMGTRTPFLTSMLAADILKDDKINIEIERHNMMAAVISGNNYESKLMPNFFTELNSIIDDIDSDFKIDTTRIYLYGICASGAKSIQYASCLPHKVAAISNVSTEVSEENLLKLENLLNIPIMLQHSYEDEHTSILPVLFFVKAAREKRIYPRMYLFKNASHTFYANSFVNLSFDFFERKAVNYSPDHINYKTNELKYNLAYWIRVDGLNYEGTPEIEAKVRRNHISVITKDISSFTLLLDSIPYDHSKEVVIEANGSVLYKGIPSIDTLTFEIFPSVSKPDAIKKNSAIEGPINHFFAKRFLVVQGTKGDETSKSSSKSLVGDFKNLWKEYYYSDCKSVNDVDVTSKELAEYNLLLTGDSETNFIIAQIEKSLPIRFLTNGFIHSGITYNSDNCIFMIYPNPLNPRRYVLVAGGSTPSGIIWPSEKSLFVQNDDFVILDAKTGNIVNSGRYNQEWQ